MNHLRHYRREAGLSQVQLARASRVSVRTILYTEKALTKPRQDVKRRLLKALGLSFADVEKVFPSGLREEA